MLVMAVRTLSPNMKLAGPVNSCQVFISVVPSDCSSKENHCSALIAVVSPIQCTNPGGLHSMMRGRKVTGMGWRICIWNLLPWAQGSPSIHWVLVMTLLHFGHSSTCWKACQMCSGLQLATVEYSRCMG